MLDAPSHGKFGKPAIHEANAAILGHEHVSRVQPAVH